MNLIERIREELKQFCEVDAGDIINLLDALEIANEALKYFSSDRIYKKETINYHGFVELEPAVITNGKFIADEAQSKIKLLIEGEK